MGKQKEAFFPKGENMGMKRNIPGNVPVTEKYMKKNKNILKTKSTGNSSAEIQVSVLTRAEWKSGHLRMQICQIR